MADLERIKKKYDTPEIDIEEATNGGNRYSLPYGLCKSVGINTEGMTPREAWEAWQNKTGKTKSEAEKEHWGEDKSDNKEEKEESKQETKEEETKSREEAINKMLESDRIKETRTFKKKRIKENLSYGTEEMQRTTANLFNDDSFLYENDRKKGTYFSPIGNRVQYKMGDDGGEGSVYSKGGVFYHETWHAIDKNYGGNNNYISKSYVFDDGQTFLDKVNRDTSSDNINWKSVKEEIENDRKAFIKETGYTEEQIKKINNNFKAKIDEWNNLPTPRPEYNEYVEKSEEYKSAYEYSKAVSESENRLKRKWGDLSDFYSGYTKSDYGLVGLGHTKSYWSNRIGIRAVEAFAECASAKATNPESYAVLKKYVPNVVKGFEEIYEALKSGRIKANARN